MSTSGEDPAVPGVERSDWIDRILEQATQQVDAVQNDAQQPTAPAVDPGESGAVSAGAAREAERRNAAQLAARRQAASRAASQDRDTPAVPDPAAMAPRPEPVGASRPADGLAEIRWVDSPDVTPAGTPVVQPAAVGAGALVAGAVGQSAYQDELRTLGSSEPEGWDKLSWQDLDNKRGNNEDPLREMTPFGGLLREWGPVVLAAVVIALFTRLVLVQAYHIPSLSMSPTLEKGDRVIVNRLSYQFGDLERGQVVVFEKPPQQIDGENDLIKRVIGLPGEQVQFSGGNVFINEFRVEEPYLAQQQSTQPRGPIPGCAQQDPARELCVVPEGYVFVMGDNRGGSSDSRVFGPIAIDSIVGRAFLRVWPLNNLGEL